MYPDAYEVGLPNQGVQILYEVLNERDWILAERTYSVWPDMEAGDAPGTSTDHPAVHRRQPPPGRRFDLFGLSFSTELGYTNMLNALDLAGIPLHAVDRGEDDPIVIAGGHAAFNPEPIADFLDAAVLGDGEEVVLAISEVVREWKAEDRPGRSRRAAAPARGHRRRLRPPLLRRRVRRRRRDRGRRAQPPRASRFRVRKHTLMDLDAVALPGQPAGAAGRDRPRALLRRDLPRLHPRLPLLPGRDDHPPGARAVDQDHRRHGRERHPQVRLRGGRPALALQRRPHRDRRGRQGPRRPLRGLQRLAVAARPPASTPSTSRSPTSSPATAAGPG